MKWTTPLLTAILLLTSVTTWAFDPNNPADKKALDDTVAIFKKCTPTSEQSLLDLLDKAKSPDCWVKDPKDGIVKGTINLSDFTDPMNSKGVTITLTKPLVIPDHVSFVSYGLVVGGLIGNKVPETPARFTFELNPSNIPTCAMTITNNVTFATSVENAGTVNLEIIPGKVADKEFLHKDTALCIKGNNNIILGLTIGNDADHYFVNGITIDGKANLIGKTKITSLFIGILINQGGDKTNKANMIVENTITTHTNGIVVKKEGNLVHQNTITTKDSNCAAVDATSQECIHYNPFGGIVLDAPIDTYGNIITSNSLTKPNTNMYFGYSDCETYKEENGVKTCTKPAINPYLSMEGAANVLTLNKLPTDNLRSNYIELYGVILGKSLPDCPNTVKIGILEIKYKYIYNPKDPKNPTVVCADYKDKIYPACPTLSKLTGECACTSDKVCSCPAGTKIADGNICVPDSSYSAPEKFSCPEGTAPDSTNKICIKTVTITKTPATSEVVTLSTEFSPIIANPSSGGGSCSLVPDQVVSAMTPISVFLITIGLTGFTAYRSSVKPQRVLEKTKE